MDSVLEGGFADPVLEAQSAFRAIMTALANPGSVQKLSHPGDVWSSIGPELASVLLTLTDHDTPIWCASGLRNVTFGEFVGFHTGAPIVAEPSRAMFAFAGTASELPPLQQFNLGTQEYPDRSTTIVLAAPSLTDGPDLTIRGPGIKHHGHIGPQGLPADFVAQWAANRELFPRGIDLLVVGDGAVMGLPRSTRISEGH